MARINRPTLEEKIIPTLGADEFDCLIAVKDPKHARTQRERFWCY